MKQQIINKIIELLNSNIVNGELLNGDKIQALIDSSSEILNLKDYYAIVYTMLCKFELETASNINEIFLARPKFSIETYKKILRFQAAEKFDEFKVKNSNLFVTFSRNLCEDLKRLDVNDVLKKYAKELEMIGIIDKSNIIIHYIKEHKSALLSYDSIRINNTKTDIRNYIKFFNGKYKEYYIKKYIEEKIEKIKPYFEIKKKEEKVFGRLDPDAFVMLVLNDITVSNDLKKIINTDYGTEINNITLKKIILNIINEKHFDNYKILNVENILENIKKTEEEYKQMKAYHRLARSYIILMNKQFKDFDKDTLLMIFDNLENLNSYRNILSQGQYTLLDEIKIIYKEAKCNFAIINNNMTFIKDDKLSNPEYISVKKKCLMMKKYQKLVRHIFNYYTKVSKTKFELTGRRIVQEEEMLFDDDNYKLKNVEIFMNIDILFNIIKKLDKIKIEAYDEETIAYIKKIIFNDGILGCAMECRSNIDIASIINGIGTIKDFETIKKFKKTDISYLLKQTNLYGIADDLSISILGCDVANKIINNAQFIQSNTNYEKQERLKKAVKLNVMALRRDKSAIPFDTISFKDVTLLRYMNDFPDILTTGIDSNTCIKIDGNDNDFLIYSMLNKLCAIYKICYGKEGRIGHIICFRQANVFFINGVRVYTGKDDCITKDIISRNNDIFNAILKLANQLISSTTNTDYPIDFVVCNKAGILESSYFDDNYYIVPDYLVNQPIDIYNDDWEEFIHLFDREKNNLFRQVKLEGKSVFTTDFGSFPALMIASRDNRYLERKFDIAYFSPGAIYQRPTHRIETYKNNFVEHLEQIYRIDALMFVKQVRNLDVAHKLYRRRKIKVEEIEEISIGDYYYKIVYNDGKIEEVNLDFTSPNIKNVAVKKQKIKK